MRKVIYALLVVLAIVAVIRIVYEYNIHKEAIMAATRFEKRQAEVMKKGAPKVQMLDSIDEIEKSFYTDLTTCTDTNLADSDGTNYVIYGKEGGKCSFEKYSVSYSLQCVVPMDVAKQYAISGQTTKEYVDVINNDTQYCQISYDAPAQKTKKRRK